MKRTAPLLAFWFLLAVVGHAQELSTIDKQKPFTLSGSVNASVGANTISGTERRRDPFAWMLSGSLTPTLYGVQLPLTFVFSQQDKGYTQPFNQFGVSPSYKSLRTHLGYRSMTLSRYTLAGVTFLGAGFEFNPGVVRLAGMVGGLQKAIEEDTTRAGVIPAYKRDGYAFKLGFGNERTFVDLSYLRAYDDTSSLTRAPKKSDVAPAENAALGMNTRIGVMNNLSIEAEGGATLFTHDLRAAKAKIDSTAVPEFLLGVYDVRNSTTLNFAGRAGIVYTGDGYGVRVGYEYVEPEFSTLGAYSFSTDLSNWTIEPNLTLMEGGLRFNGSIGLQHDNVLGTKLAQTDRVIGSFNIGYNREDFGADANYSNYSSSQSAGRAPINDSIRARNVTQSGTLTPRLTIRDEVHSHTVSLLMGYQEYTDLNAYTSLYSNNRTTTASLIYSLAFLQSKLNGGASILYSGTEAAATTTRTLSASLSAGTTMLAEDALSLNGTLSYALTTIAGIDGAGNTITTGVSTSYRISKQDNLGLNFNLSHSAGSLADTRSFTEFTTLLNYSRSFQILE